jgi:CRP-like cAMP-binding protein
MLRVTPRAPVLFQQGTAASLISVVESAEMGIVLPTGQNHQLLEVAGSGTVLGFSESRSGDNHRVTAEASDHTTFGFICRESFVASLRTSTAISRWRWSGC